MKVFSSMTIICWVVLAVDATQVDLAKKDLESIQGDWQCIALEVEGKAVPAELIKSLILTFKGDKGSHKGPDGKTEEATIKLDPSKKPKEIDLVPLAGPNKGKAVLAIYSIEGNTLKICGRKGGTNGARPTEFKAGEGVNLIVFQRAKP